MNKSLQQYYLNAMGMPQWQLRQTNEHDVQENIVVYLAAGETDLVFPIKNVATSEIVAKPSAEIELKQSSQASFFHSGEGIKAPGSESPKQVDSDSSAKTTVLKAAHKSTEVLKEPANSIEPINVSEAVSKPISTKALKQEQVSEPALHNKPLHENEQNALAQLESKIIACSKCQRRAYGQDSVGGKFLIHPNAEEDNNLFIITEPPTETEYHNGNYLTPVYKQLLMAILNAVGLTSYNIYLTGILKCSPNDNHPGTDEELNYCQSFLEQELDIVQPRVVISLGSSSAYLLNKKNPDDEESDRPISLSKTRLDKHELSLGKHRLPLYSTFHPAFLYRNPLFKSKALDDWIKISSHMV